MIENEDLWTSDFWVNKNYEINDEAKEGHVGIYPNKIENLVKYSKMINSGSLIAEIGFNLGHSAHTILSNAETIKSRSGGSQSAPGKIRTSEVIVFERTA